MRIGMDFDNTIVDYTGVFYAAALKRSLIPAELPNSKAAVRAHLNESGRAEEFTLLQGHVYGAHMDLARPYPGVAAFVAAASAAGHVLHVVSHKSRRPILGPAHDLHAAARGFLAANGFLKTGMIPPESVFFEPSQEAKVARIGALALDAFIDDLPAILNAVRVGRPILFDPDEQHRAGRSAFERYGDWRRIQDTLIG